VAIEQILRLEFGKDGQTEDRVGTGWSLAETSHRWMVGPYSELRLGPFVAGGDYFFTLEVEPFIKPPALEAQRLSISIGGVPFIQTELTAGGRFGYRIPPELIAEDGDLVMVFDHPDAARPSEVANLKDHRPLAISVSSIEIWKIQEAGESAIIEGGGGLSIAETEHRTGLPASEFVTRFESLGDNCEFGLVQRRCGAEPLSLLRFANTLLPSLLRGLQTRFAGLGEPADLAFRLEGRTKPEYIIQEKSYGLVYHTFRYKGEIDEDKFIASESARLKFLIRKFVEDLQGGEKIFVIKRNAPLREEEILPVVAAINAYGPNTLLWVVLADDKHKPGSVEWVMPGLVRGYIDRFAPNENAHDLSLNIWLEICVNAFALWRG
jgi:hypothetical protein